MTLTGCVREKHESRCRQEQDIGIVNGMKAGHSFLLCHVDLGLTTRSMYLQEYTLLVSSEYYS